MSASLIFDIVPLGKAAREKMDSRMVGEIIETLAQVEKEGPGGFLADTDPKLKSATIREDCQHWHERARQSEEQRNRRRLCELLQALRKSGSAAPDLALPGNVIGFRTDERPVPLPAVEAARMARG